METKVGGGCGSGGGSSHDESGEIALDIPVIRFYSHVKGDHKYMSNFYRSLITDINGKQYPTAEHYFQAWKHIDDDGNLNEHGEQVRLSKTPTEAKKLGRAAHIDMTEWDKRKLDVMRSALRLKFDQHSGIRKKLIATSPSLLVEASPTDYVWGEGRNKTGTNYLGVLLVELRDEYIKLGY